MKFQLPKKQTALSQHFDSLIKASSKNLALTFFLFHILVSLSHQYRVFSTEVYLILLLN